MSFIRNRSSFLLLIGLLFTTPALFLATPALAGDEDPEQVKADFERLREITNQFGNEQIFFSSPQIGAEVAPLFAPAKLERARLAEKYADLLKQRGGDQILQSMLNACDATLERFDKAANDYADNAPARLAKQLDEARSTAKMGIENKSPAFFNPDGGVTSNLKAAQITCDTLVGLRPDTDAANQAVADMAAARVEIAALAEVLNAEILATNRVPDDQYQGADRDALLALVKEYWANSGTGSGPMHVGLNSSQWTRNTRWVWQGTSKSWYKLDASNAQGFVVVKLDDEFARVIHIEIFKNHLEEDRISLSFYDDPKEPAALQRKVKLDRVGR